MTEDISRGRRHRIVGAIGIAQILSWGSSYYLLAILARPMTDETGWPFAWIIGGISIGLLAAGLCAVRVGRAIERHGGRPVLAVSSGLLATGLAILAFSPTFPVYFLGWVVLGTGMAAGLYDAAFSTLARLFGDTARSAITALTLWGGFASTVCWPISAFLVETIGWRGTCATYAVIQIAVVLPLYLLVLPRERHRGVSATTPRPSTASTGEVPAERRSIAFVILAAMMTISGTVAALLSVHIIAMLQAGGLTLAAAVATGTLLGPAQVASRIVEILSGGRHHPMWTLGVSVTLSAGGIVLLWLGFTIPAVALIAYGAGNGLWSIARGTVPLRLFGSSRYAVLMGKLATPSLIAQAAAPFIGAMLLETIDTSGTFTVLVGLALANVAGAAALWYVSASRS